MSSFVVFSQTVLYGTAWTGTAPGPGNPTISGTITSSTDYSDHVQGADGNVGIADIDFTNMGSGGFAEHKPGLIDLDMKIKFFQDFAASSIHAVFGAAALARTLVYLDIKPTNAARGATNPSTVMAGYVMEYPAVYEVGQGVMAEIAFMSAGKFAFLTS